MDDDKLTVTDLNSAIKSLNAMRAEIQPMLDAIKEQEEAIKSYVIETREEHPQIAIRKSYTKVTWKAKELDGYAASHPEILQFRTETEVKESVSIKRA